MSDDSHGISQVGTNYKRLLMFIESINAPPVTFLEKSSSTKDARFPGVSTSTVSVAKIKEHPFFAGIFQ